MQGREEAVRGDLKQGACGNEKVARVINRHAIDGADGGVRSRPADGSAERRPFAIARDGGDRSVRRNLADECMRGIRDEQVTVAVGGDSQWVGERSAGCGSAVS